MLDVSDPVIFMLHCYQPLDLCFYYLRNKDC